MIMNLDNLIKGFTSNHSCVIITSERMLINMTDTEKLDLLLEKTTSIEREVNKNTSYRTKSHG